MKYLMFHMPKTGGQSINVSFRKYLKNHEEVIHLSGRGEVHARRLGLLPWGQRPKKERDKAILVTGHAVNKNTQFLFKTGMDARHMVVFREPAKLLVSLYNYKYRFKEKAPSFKRWYFSLRIRGLKNWQATVFYRQYLKGYYLTSYFLNDFNYFKEILDTFWYVGAIERINEDFKEIAKFMDISEFEMERINVANTKDRKKHVHLTEKLRKKLNHENKLDFDLYQYALNRGCPKYVP